jgi:hypothetical protein
VAFSGFQDLDRRFAPALQQYFNAYPGLGAYSGYRSIEHQRQLWLNSDRTGHTVAAPGHSQHNFGRAADLEYNGVRLDRLPPETQAMLHQGAAQFGLTYPMSYEAWHVEPIGARGGANPQVAQPRGVAMAEPQASQSGQVPGMRPPPPMPQQPMAPNPYWQALFGEGGNADWMQNRSYSMDALAGDFFAGHNPLRRLIYQKLFM